MTEATIAVISAAAHVSRAQRVAQLAVNHAQRRHVIVIAAVLPIIANARSAALLAIPSTSSCPIRRTTAIPNRTSPTRKTFPKIQAKPKPFWQIIQSTQRQNAVTIPKV